MDTLTVPQGTFNLARFPMRNKDPLRAWDAADEYVLHHLHEEGLCSPKPGILILNDLFGALSVALADCSPRLISDSYLTQQGTLANFKNNGLHAEQVRFFNSLHAHDEPADLVLIKIPRSMAFLEDQLHRLRPCLHADTRIIGVGMAKGIHTSTLQLFERILGPTRTSLARKKARLIFCSPDLTLTPGPSLYPSSYTLEETGHVISNHANVFSREKLDLGTRYLLENMPRTNTRQTVIDLGCGNGVVGLVAASRNPKAELVFTDESFMAVASAQANFQAAFGGQRTAQFHVADDLVSVVQAESADLVLNNPPFHQERGQGDMIARDMFRASKTVLKHRGELWVVGNRHLAYHITLEQIFGNCRTIAGNQKFVILKVIKR